MILIYWLRNSKRNILKKDLRSGYSGCAANFDGTVYDTGIGQAPLPYRSNANDPKTFRPFYLLVLGRHADIAHYFDRLIANGFQEAQTVIFSRYLVNPLLSFEGAEIKTENLNSKIINRDHSQDLRLKQYEIVENTKTAKISAAELTYNRLRHAMSFNSDTFEFEVSVVAKHKLMEETQISPDAQECLEVTPKFSKNENSNELSVQLSLSSSLYSAIYLYEVTLRPGIDSYQAPDWCSEWDMGTARDGSKTLNLVNFVRDLSQVTARMHRPIIAKFHCYIEKR